MKQHIKALNKQMKTRAAHRRQEVIKLTSDGIPVPDIANQLGVSRRTVYNDLATLAGEFVDGNREAFKDLKTLQVGSLLDLAARAEAGELEPEIVNAVGGLIKQVTNLLGLNSPRLIARFDVKLTPATLRQATKEELMYEIGRARLEALVGDFNEDEMTQLRDFVTGVIARRSPELIADVLNPDPGVVRQLSETEIDQHVRESSREISQMMQAPESFERNLLGEGCDQAEVTDESDDN